MARVARAPDGTNWKIRRFWLPRLRNPPDIVGGEALNLGLSGIDSLTVFLAVLAVVVFGAIVLVTLPYVFFALELLVLPAVLAYRIVFRRPWTVEAKSESSRRRWPVVGWRRSGEAVEEIARAIERGESPVIK